MPCSIQSELDWKDRVLRWRKRFGTVLQLLVVSTSGLDYNLSLLFDDGVILSRCFILFYFLLLHFWFSSVDQRVKNEEWRKVDIIGSLFPEIIGTASMDFDTEDRRFLQSCLICKSAYISLYWKVSDQITL